MKTVFFITLSIQYLMVLGVLWSILRPQNRVWPPPYKISWQFIVTWFLFCSGTVGKLAVIVLDWNTWIIPDEIRFYLGVPIILVGAVFTLWGIKTLGVKNTEGENVKFISDGPYRFSRNPQYLGDIAIFAGIILLSNSFHVMVLESIAILVFLIAPLTEEIWLEKQYLDRYMNYKVNVARFL